MSREQLCALLDKYRAVGVVRRVEFLVPPGEAVRFARDLAALGAVIVGADFWSYVDRQRGWVMELVGADLPVDQYIPWADMTPAKNLVIVEDWLVNKLFEGTDLVSFLWKDNEWYDWMEECLSHWTAKPDPAHQEAFSTQADAECLNKGAL